MRNAEYGKVIWFDRGQFNESNPPWRYVIFLTKWTKNKAISLEEYALHYNMKSKCYRIIKTFPKEDFDKCNFIKTLIKCRELIGCEEVVWIEKPSWHRKKYNNIYVDRVDWNHFDIQESINDILDSRVLYELRMNTEYD